MNTVNYIRQHLNFYSIAKSDKRLKSSHMSMYNALFQLWNKNNWITPVSVSRGELMRISKIGSKATYYKCLKELTSFQYIMYMPSNNPYKGSFVHMIKFKPSVVSETVQVDTKSETSDVPIVVPSLNNINLLNNSNKENDHSKIIINKNNSDKKNSDSEESSDENMLALKIPPSENDVENFFLSMDKTKNEAQMFFNHYESVGWKVGRSQMKNWTAAAKKWILNNFQNSKKYTQGNTLDEKPGYKINTQDIDYNKPL